MHPRTLALPLALLPLLAACSAATGEAALAEAGRASEPAPARRLFLDVHHLPGGAVSAADVAAAHAKDLAVQGAHGVDYLEYWVDESEGKVFCLVEAPSPAAAIAVHREAHGLVADELLEVERGVLPSAPEGGRRLFLDTHLAGPGALTFEGVADAHRADLAVQAKHGVRFLRYWVDEASGRVHCLAEADDPDAIHAAHAEAHGLVPDRLNEVVVGW